MNIEGAMGRKQAKYPKPNIRFKDGSWRIYWAKNRKVFEAVIGACSEEHATNIMHNTALALREAGEWPQDIVDAPAVRKYLCNATHNENSEENNFTTLYMETLAGEVSQDWFRNSQYYLSKLDKWIDDFPGTLELNHDEAQRIINNLSKKLATETRNKYLQAYKRFYGWLLKTRRIAANPFLGIKTIKPRRKRSQAIEYLTVEEREIVLEAADKTDNGLSVWLAFFAGMRRGEIWSCEWGDINFNNSIINIPETKTGTPRVVPISERLEKKLLSHRQGKGTILKKEPDITWKVSARRVTQKIRILCKGKVPSKLIKWNNFRHTFCSLLALNGISLDVISEYSGHDPKTCREYYAQLIPKDKRDDRVNLLD